MEDHTALYPHLRILVVDDHFLIRNMVSQSLGELGCRQVDCAPNGSDALEMMERALRSKNPYHVIMLDWHMPQMEGITLLEKCRSDKRYDRTAIMMLTAEREQKNIVRALEAGATSYLVKPVSKAAMASHLAKIAAWLFKNDPEMETLKKNRTEEEKKTVKAQEKWTKIHDIRAELESIVTDGVKQIFSDMFSVSIMREETPAKGNGKDFVCAGRLHEDDMSITLRFHFDQNLLQPLLAQIYAPDYLADEEIYCDAACEIVNILGNQIKSRLNDYGYALSLDFPEICGDMKAGAGDSVLNVRFSLNSERYFIVDVEASQNTA
ncbi:MAG: response regulator [Micavibrio sp.]|nr:MAG: response regulator [Micavibrio sp.]